MNAELKHALWLRPFGDVAFDIKQRIKSLSEKYDTPIFEPHITLLGGLDQSETELIQYTDTLASSLNPFSVELTTLGYHDTFYQAFFARVKKTDALLTAHQTAQQFFGCSADEDYFPHLSLMYGHIDENEKQKLISRLGRNVDVSFPVHSLLLVEYDPDGPVSDWKKIHTAEFKHP